MAKDKKIQSTQKYLNILAIKEGIIILKDGGLRIVLKVNSLNFALKSEEEQSGLINQYQGFLNALKFDIQIIMQSRRLDLYNYMRYLKEIAQQQTNEMIKIQTEDYINYIERLLTKANIMDKRFYVVIPFFPTGIQQKGWIDKILGGGKTAVQFSSQQFKSYQEQLLERANIVTQGLGGMGLKVTPLSTQEVIELLYSIYNPEEAMSERLVEASGLSAPIIGRAGEVEEEIQGEQKTDKEKKDKGSDNNVISEEQKQGLGAPGQEKKVDNITQPNANNQQIPLGAEVKIGGQNFFPTPQALQSMPVTPEVSTPPETAAPGAVAQSAKDEPMTKEKADAILGRVLDSNGAKADLSAGAKLWSQKENEAPKQNITEGSNPLTTNQGLQSDINNSIADKTN